MARLYINGDEVRFTKRDMCLVDVEFYDGRRFESLEPRRLFPISGLTRYITLLDPDGKEIAIIRNIDTLMPESKKIIEACLREFEQHIDLHAEDRTEQVSLFLNEAGNILLDDSDGARVGKNVAQGAFGRDSHIGCSFLI